MANNTQQIGGISKNELAFSINTISGTCATPFWDSIYERTVSLDSVKGFANAIDALHNAGKDMEALYLIFVILIIVVIIAAIASSPLGIFFSNDPDAGGMTAREVVQTLQSQVSARRLSIIDGYGFFLIRRFYIFYSESLNEQSPIAIY